MIQLDGKPINITKFPDKTSQVWKIENITSNITSRIDWYFEDEAEIIQLAQLKDLLDSKRNVPELHIHYLPYGRQDKDIANDATFALHTFAKLLNAMGFLSIIITDPHSAVAELLIKNSSATYKCGELQEAISRGNIDVICFPDKGAFAKYKDLPVYSSLPRIVGSKVRDQATGHITSYTIDGDVKGKNVLIADDICDGGATFIILAQSLLALGAKNVNLFVTHGLFTKGKQVLIDAGISAIY